MQKSILAPLLVLGTFLCSAIFNANIRSCSVLRTGELGRKTSLVPGRLSEHDVDASFQLYFYNEYLTIDCDNATLYGGEVRAEFCANSAASAIDSSYFSKTMVRFLSRGAPVGLL